MIEKVIGPVVHCLRFIFAVVDGDTGIVRGNGLTLF